MGNDSLMLIVSNHHLRQELVTHHCKATRPQKEMRKSSKTIDFFERRLNLLNFRGEKHLHFKGETQNHQNKSLLQKIFLKEEAHHNFQCFFVQDHRTP